MAVESAPETIRDIDPDALLVDLRRPDEHEYGLRVIEELRADPDLKALPIFLRTAGAQEVRQWTVTAALYTSNRSRASSGLPPALSELSAQAGWMTPPAKPRPV